MGGRGRENESKELRRGMRGRLGIRKEGRMNAEMGGGERTFPLKRGRKRGREDIRKVEGNKGAGKKGGREREGRNHFI